MHVDDTNVQDPNLPKVGHSFNQETTLREIYDYVVDFISRQGRAALGPDGSRCQYVTPDGLRCAAGCLMREDAALGLNPHGALHSIVQQSDIAEALGWWPTAQQMALLQKLQVSHDRNSFLSTREVGKDFVTAFRNTARMVALPLVEREEAVARSNGPKVLR